MTNRMTMHDRFVEIIMGTRQTGPIVTHTIEETREACAKLREHRKPVLILADVRSVEHINLDAFEVITKNVADTPFERVALVGPHNGISEKLVSSLTMGLGLRDTMRYFTNRKQAEDWLLYQK